MRLHIAGVSIKARGSHVKEDGLKENQEVFKITLSAPKDIVLGQQMKSLQKRGGGRQVRLMDVGFLGAPPPTRGLSRARGQHPFRDVSRAMLPISC